MNQRKKYLEGLLIWEAKYHFSVGKKTVLDVLKMGYTSSPLFLDKIQEAWAKIISDAPDTVIKELAAAVHHTYGQRRHISLNSGWTNGNRFGVYEKRKNNFYEIRPYPLNMAAACNLQSSCKYIIQKKFEILCKYENIFGHSPIHIAAQNGHFNVFKMLFEDSIDKCPQNTMGQSTYYLVV